MKVIGFAARLKRLEAVVGVDEELVGDPAQYSDQQLERFIMLSTGLPLEEALGQLIDGYEPRL